MTKRCLASTATSKAIRSFWLLGLLNNAPWVLMLAVATNISAGGVALVFLSNQIPGLIVKITAPYWFHLASYKARMRMASVSMGVACFLVGCGGLFRDERAEDGDDSDSTDPGPQDVDGQKWGLALELLGVSFVSFSCNLGEASLLALAGKFDSSILPRMASSADSYQEISEIRREDTIDNASQQNDGESLFMEEFRRDDNDGDDDETQPEEDDVERLMNQETIPQRRSITAFSSGTGLAGIVGYGYKALFSELFGWGLSATVWSAMAFAVAYWIIYIKGLHEVEQSMHQETSMELEDGDGEPIILPVASESLLLAKDEKNEGYNNSRLQDNVHNSNTDNSRSSLKIGTEKMCDNTMQQFQLEVSESSMTPHDLTAFEKCKFVLSLWPYTIPLFTVYAAEYMLQAGVWSAIGFPVTSSSSRAQFYHYSNWTYQAGVFLSRSSGNLCTAPLPILWLMPLLQVANLYFFWLNSIHHFLYNYALLLPCFIAGLLGGGVYVQGYTRVNMDMPKDLREFAIASVGVADSLGILVADILSLFIQSCIYKENNIQGAVVDCPF